MGRKLLAALAARPSSQTTDAWPARRSREGDAALWVACVILALGLISLIAAATREIGPTMLLLTVVAVVVLGVGVAFGVWALAYRRLEYVLADSALHVHWLGETVVVPYTAIDGIYTGQRLVGHATPSMPCWPGIYVGPGRLRGTGRLRFFATSPDPAALTLVNAQHSGIVLSARNPQEFRTALIERVEQSPETARPEHVYSRPADTAPWSAIVDRWLPACTAASLILLLVVLALVIYGLPNLTDLIPLHFNASGEPSQIGPKQDLLRLPLIGLLLLCVDIGLGVWRHPVDRLLARVLWVGSVALQAALVVAVVRLLQ